MRLYEFAGKTLNDILLELNRREFLRGLAATGIIGGTGATAIVGSPFTNTKKNEEDPQKTRMSLERERKQDIETCKKNGEHYYKSIGSWPYLSNGMPAAGTIQGRCERQPKTAFSTPSPKKSKVENEIKRNEVRKQFANDPDLIKSLEQIWKDEDAGKYEVK